MICRGGIVADRPRLSSSAFGRGGERARRKQPSARSVPSLTEELHAAPARTSWSTVVVAVVSAAILLWFLPGRSGIAPLVESDYCYLLIAADRMHNGMGPTSLQPVAPLQPWEWRYDWGFLTQWPVGYATLIAANRWMFGVTSITAAKGVSILACAFALAGWFSWIRRCVPRGGTSVLLAALAAACAVPVGSLLNPSTDAILMAGLPIVLLLVSDAVAIESSATAKVDRQHSPWRFALAGVLAGALCWFRYAAIFVPAAILLFLLIVSLRRRIRGRSLVSFLVGVATPIAALCLVTGLLGATVSVGERFNLGQRTAWHGSWSLLWTAWWNLTDLGFYAHRPIVHWTLALGPIALIPLVLVVRPTRRSLSRLILVPTVALSACVVTTLVVMLIVSTAVFGDKFNYVGLERYYLPGKPLFLVLAVLPLMLIPRRVVRAGVSCLVVACAIWVVQVEWVRAYQSAIVRQKDATPYGQWNRCFTPDAGALYSWLRSQASPELVVVSNYHETIALETGLPTLPVPNSPEQLRGWLDRLAASRGVAHSRVLFVVDTDNRWRSYWIPDVPSIRETFELVNPTSIPNVATDAVYQYPQS